LGSTGLVVTDRMRGLVGRVVGCGPVGSGPVGCGVVGCRVVGCGLVGAVTAGCRSPRRLYATKRGERPRSLTVR
jgi:hypothetical protein